MFGKTDEWECLGFLLLFALNAMAEGIERPLRGLRLVGESVHRIRLHPDDIADLFQCVTIGTPVVIVYEPILLAQDGDGTVFLEVHPDIYRRAGDRFRSTERFANARGLRAGDNSLLERARKARVRHKGLLLQGLPHEEIASAAKSKKADLVVVGTHGRTGMARVFLGSVAARVISSSPCPVLAVRGR